MNLENINEDWYKNIFRLLNSPKPEASVELKKIRDELVVLYEAKGITEYYPPIPGDNFQTSANEGSSGSADYLPVSTRKFEKPIAPIRKDSLPTDRGSPHLAALRSNSPRLSSISAASVDSNSTPLKSSIPPDDQSDVSDSGLLNSSADSSDGNSTSFPITLPTATVTSQATPNVEESQKRKISGEIDQSSNSSDDQVTKKREADRRTHSDDTAPSASIDEPVEKKPKVSFPTTTTTTKDSNQVKIETNESSNDFDGLACVVCKTFSLDNASNLMVECHECHNMYHQKCHQPVVPTSQIVDPRLLWFCHQCDKKKKVGVVPVSTKATPTTNTAGRRNTATSSVKDEKKSVGDSPSSGVKRSGTMESKEKQAAPSSSWAFGGIATTFLEKHKKKAGPSPPQKASGSTAVINPFAMALSSAASSNTGTKFATTTTTSTGGLSKLAGNFQQQISSSSNTTKATTTTTTSSSTVASTSSAAAKAHQTSSSQLLAAEKRLQMMKKKAAMKGSFKI